ncbi:unnamed protein product, partial [Thlaspi arvense]
MILTKHKRDVNMFVLQLGAALAVSFAGFLFSRFRKKTNRIGPTLPPLRPKSSDHGYRVCSNKSIDNGDAETQKTKKEETLSDVDEKDVFLLPEFEEELKNLDLLLYDECETPKSDISVPLAFPSEEEADHENEIKRLRNTVRALRERERCLEDKLLEYYSLKEQQKIAMELRSRLKLNQMETKVFNLKIKSLQAENEKLKAQCSEHSKVALELDLAKSQVQNLELAEKLESVQIIATSKLEEPEEMETLREDGNRLRSENEELKKEIEQLQGDRCTDLEQLVYLKWINACLRYELRTYQPPAGKTVARDLSTTLSPKSEEKAKQLILEYAHSEGHEEDNNTDYDRWSSSQEESSMITESMFLDDSSVDTLFATNTKKSGKKKLMHKLMKILHGKDTQERKKRGGSSEPSSSNTGAHSTPRHLRSTLSMDFQMLMRGKDEEEEFKMLRRKSEAADCSIYGEEGGEHCLESDEMRKKELVKYAEALRKSRSAKKLHKKSVSFFF